MEKIKFNIIAHDSKNFSAGYFCTKSGDQSGEYVRAEVAEELLALIKSALQESCCDGDLCSYAWHEKARQIISKHDSID